MEGVEARTSGGAAPPVSIGAGPDARPMVTNMDVVDSISVALVEGSFPVDCAFSFSRCN